MKKRNNTAKGFLLGVMVTLLLMLTTGEIYRQTNNVSHNTTTSFQSIYACDDGNIVYVCDNNTVYRSMDGGDSWTIVLKKKSRKL